MNYYVIVQGEGSGCETQSTTAQVIVTPGPSIADQPLATQTICLGGTPSSRSLLDREDAGGVAYILRGVSSGGVEFEEYHHSE